MWLGGGVVAKVTGDRWAMGGTGLRVWNDEEAEEVVRGGDGGTSDVRLKKPAGVTLSN
jgi:hypothetical protein